MYEEERKAAIVEYVQKNLRASIDELAMKYSVSKSTIRRDLMELENNKLIKRTHGGAISMEVVSFEPTFTEKESRYAQEKELIAQKAVEFIQDGDTIIMDAGTTTFLMSKHLKSFSDLTVVTNSIMIAQELLNCSKIEVIVVGGSLRKSTQALVGPLTDEALEKIHVDTCFIATNGLDIREGLTTPNITEATTKRRMMDSAKSIVLLADHTKIGKVSFAKFGNISEIDQFIVDDKIPEDVLNSLVNMNVRVCVATTESEE